MTACSWQLINKNSVISSLRECTYKHGWSLKGHPLYAPSHVSNTEFPLEISVHIIVFVTMSNVASSIAGWCQ